MKKYQILIPLLLLFILFMWSSRLGTDGYELEYFLSAQNVIENGSFTMSITPDGLPGLFDRHPDQPTLPRHNLLQAALSIPLYLAGMPFNSLFKTADSGMLALPKVSLLFVSLLNPILTILSILLIILICKQLNIDRAASVMTGIVYGCATMAWPYAGIGMEPLQITSLLGSIAAFLKCKDKTNTLNTSLLASTLFLLMHTKISAPLIALPISLAGLFIIFRQKTHRMRNTLTYVSILLSSSALWFYLYYLRLSGFYSSAFFQNFSPDKIPVNILGFCISPGKSLFAYNPILLWCLPGIAAFITRNRLLSMIFSAIIVLNLILTSCWDWALIEECWGPRYLSLFVPLFLIAGAERFDLKQPRRQKLLLAILLVLSFLVQVPGVLYPGVSMMMFVLSPDMQIVDLTSWHPELSPIRVGWHMIFNKIRVYQKEPVKDFAWKHYRGIIGWGTRPETTQFHNHQWNRPYILPFIIARYLQVQPGGNGLEYPDPPVLIVIWLTIACLLCILIVIWYYRFLKQFQKDV